MSQAHAALQPLALTRHNLPRQLTSFIGREGAIGAVAALLKASPLVTLTGVGGTGKTRLALAVADAVRATYLDGVSVVSLAEVTDPQLVVPAIARTLALPETPQRTAVETLTDFLRDKAFLLVLDNFEQVVSAAPALATLLAACPRLALLVTSRAVLHLSGEQVFPVPPLTLPDRRVTLSPRQVRRSEAVQLFIARALAARADVVLHDEQLPLVVELCHRLEGLPLAIELAAVRLRTLPLQALLARLEQRLPLLTGGARDLPLRQQTLRNTIAWSYDLLAANEQALFRQLAVFHGTALDAIEAVCGGPASLADGATAAGSPPALDTLAGITSLVEQSLLRQIDAAEGSGWYAMLETVREYALECLEESGEADTIRRRQVRYYLALAEEAEQGVLGPGQADWFARLEREHDNLRAVIRWCRERGYAEPAFRIAVALWWFWAVHGHVGEGRVILADLLARFPFKEAAERHIALRARALRAAGMLASIQGDRAAARVFHGEGLGLQRRLGDHLGVYGMLESLGLDAELADDRAAARGYLEEACAVARLLDDPQYLANALHNLGSVVHTQGDHVAARAILEDCVARRRTLADPECLAAALLSLAAVTHDLGDPPHARQLVQEAVALYREAGNRRKEALALAHLGGIALAEGDYAAARDALRVSVLAQRALGDRAGIAFVLERFIGLALAEGEPLRAIRLAAAAATLRQESGTPLPAEARGQLDDALRSARRALGAAAADAAWLAGSTLGLDDAIAEALAQHAAGTAPARLLALSRREREVATLIAEGQTNRQIATALFITEGTVANHVAHILNKLAYTSRAQIAVWATRQALPALLAE